MAKPNFSHHWYTETSHSLDVSFCQHTRITVSMFAFFSQKLLFLLASGSNCSRGQVCMDPGALGAASPQELCCPFSVQSCSLGVSRNRNQGSGCLWRRQAWVPTRVGLLRWTEGFACFWELQSTSKGLRLATYIAQHFLLHSRHYFSQKGGGCGSPKKR